MVKPGPGCRDDGLYLHSSPLFVMRIGALKYKVRLNVAASPACWRDGDRDGYAPGLRSIADAHGQDRMAPPARSPRRLASARRRPAARRFGERGTRLRHG